MNAGNHRGSDLGTEARVQWPVMGHCLQTGQTRISAMPITAGKGGWR